MGTCQCEPIRIRVNEEELEGHGASAPAPKSVGGDSEAGLRGGLNAGPAGDCRAIRAGLGRACVSMVPWRRHDARRGTVSAALGAGTSAISSAS
jgi:hypothetical protein